MSSALVWGGGHLVNVYEVKAGISVIAGNTVWSIPERLECEVLHKVRYINTLTFSFTFVSPLLAVPNITARLSTTSIPTRCGNMIAFAP